MMHHNRSHKHFTHDHDNDVGRDSSVCSVPAELAVRRNLISLAEERVRDMGLLPPLSINELREHGRFIRNAAAINSCYDDFATLVINNALWRDTVAAVPFERRILLLPQCLSHSEKCPAEMDEMGLLCTQCGNCVIGILHERAEKLGYVVLVAEGTTVVTQLLEQGKVDAVVGVSCLSVLEKAFPYMAAQAIPGLAVPLLRDGCIDTEIDLEWLSSVIELSVPGFSPETFSIEVARATVRKWFAGDSINELLGIGSTSAGKLAQMWLSKAGKRWRPFLTVCAYQILSGLDADAVRKIAVAIECFHKASLVHDDIEDGDNLRYGQETLHHGYGIPVALNVGDLLIGEGYRLIAESGFSPEVIHELLTAASDAHRALCFGQGEELMWSANPSIVNVKYVLDIFRLKTGPAFEVALSMGAICANAPQAERLALREFSNALGVCYQIKDDLEDFHEKRVSPLVPSILLAIACEHDESRVSAMIKQWSVKRSSESADWIKLYLDADAHNRARQLLSFYRHEAMRSLEALSNTGLKNLLRRTVVWILGE